MASQRRFEGTVLEDVLDQVRRDVGSGARIVAANRVRKGGVAGFFAREHYEVIVEVPEGERAHARVVADPEERPAAPGRVRVPSSILDLAEAVNDAERAAPDIDLVDESRPSTERAAFADVLERITEAAGGGDDADDADRRPDLSLHAETEDENEDEEPEAGAGRPMPALGNGHSSRAGRPLAPEPPSRRTGGTRRPAGSTARATRRGTSVTSVLERVSTDDRAADDQVDATEHETPAAPRRGARRTEEVIERPENALVRLGVPARLVPRGVALRELQGALVETMSRLPAPPPLPDAPGVVVAVVGAGAEPVLLARELAEELGIDPDCVVLAVPQPLTGGIPTWLQVCDAATAEERRRSWRRRAHPTIVACSLPPGRAGLGWAREILDHLEPTCTWAIVDACWKCEDVQHWSDALGGVDVMALTNLEETVSPASVLDLGIPVGRLDDRVATPVAWAEMLFARLK
ncbi:MAG: hypothetical protein KatS3mg010_1469 [Acidimicrobiia bacterium]|nr:MAG: hypothetical protein KatS3mg010_1469 [Acidimicrobiia bacterium]